MGSIRLGFITAVLATVTLAPTALARPAADVTFGGRTSAHWPVMVQLSRDGRKVTYAVAAWSAQCSDGPFADYEEFAQIPVSARGRFSSSYDTGDYQQDSATVRYAASIAGKLNKRHTRIKGTVRVFSSAKDPANGVDSTCDTGTVKFVAVN